MKKLAFLTGLSSFWTASLAFAANEINIEAPAQGYKDLGKFVTNILQLSFVIAVLVVLFMLVWGAFEWITSGGDKEAVGKARNRIINALIGLAVLAVAFALFKVAGNFLGFEAPNFSIPRPN